MVTKRLAIVLIVLCTFITSSGQLFMKAGVKDLSMDALLTNYTLAIGLFFYILGAVLLVVALKYGELSVIYPLLGLSYVWVSLLSPRFFATDSMNLEKWFGVVVIIGGVYAIGRGSR